MENISTNHRKFSILRVLQRWLGPDNTISLWNPQGLFEGSPSRPAGKYGGSKGLDLPQRRKSPSPDLRVNTQKARDSLRKITGSVPGKNTD